MSRPPGEPLTRVTINLFSSDVTFAQRRFPNGYQEKIRALVHDWVEALEGEETLESLERMFP